MIKRSLPVILILALFFPCALNAQERGTTDMWDFITSFSCSTGRQHGIVYDGEYIYTCAHSKSPTVLSMFYKYDMNGNLLEEFDVPGVTNSLPAGTYLIKTRSEGLSQTRRVVK